MSPKRLKLLSAKRELDPVEAIIRAPLIKVKVLKKPQGSQNVTVRSVSEGGKLKLKRTGVKTLDTVKRADDLKVRKELRDRHRTTAQDAADTPLASLADLDEYVRVQRVTLPNG